MYKVNEWRAQCLFLSRNINRYTVDHSFSNYGGCCPSTTVSYINALKGFELFDRLLRRSDPVVLLLRSRMKLQILVNFWINKCRMAKRFPVYGDGGLMSIKVPEGREG
jgi:hypothetical protein